LTGEVEWAVQSPDSEIVQYLVDKLQCSRVLASALANRGITEPEDARQFLNPSLADLRDPGLLPDMSPAVERVERALDRDETIVVYADRDIDGVSGCATLVTLLQEMEANADSYLPGKFDGYGMNETAVEKLADRNADVLVTVDCGTTARPEIKQAQAGGMDVVVTDHHQPEEQLPTSLACVNPRREDSEYPHENLAGGAVAFKLAQALVASRAPARVDDYFRYSLPLTALATLGDWMTLNLENRALVREGFSRLWDCGLPGLIETARHRNVESIRDLGWSLIPFLNAAQEDEAGDLMLELLLSHDEHRISTIISQLEEYRTQRKQRRTEQQQHLETCFEAQSDPAEDAIFLVETEQYVGGHAITRLSEQWGRPVITYRRKNDGYRGGGRSDPDVDFLDLYDSCEDLLKDFWGHPGAAGFQVTETNLEPFKRRIRDAIRTQYSREELVPTIEIDTALQIEDLEETLIEELSQLRPFGSGNREPQVLVEDIEIACCDSFGDQNQHGRLSPGDTDGLSIIYWNGMDSLEEFSQPTAYNIVGTVHMDEYEQTPMLNVADCRVFIEDAERTR